MEKTKRIQNLLLFWLALALAGGAVLWLQPPCWIKALTGLDCPACGTVRMLQSLRQGQFSLAFGYNSFMFFVLPLGFILALYGSYQYLKTGQSLRTKAETTSLVLLIVSAFVFVVLRNII